MILGLEEVENFKDVEISFSNAREHDSDINYSVDEEINYRTLEENLPRRSGQKASRTLREEQANKDI
jgi:hypothetical protein